MGSITDFLEGELLDHVFNAAYTPPTTVYLALFESDPLDAGSGTETAYTSYARQAITFSAASSRSIAQSGSISFPANGGTSVNLTHWGVFDAATVGNLMAHGALTATKTINNGDTPSVASGEVTISVSAGEVSNYLANLFLDFAFRNQAFSAPATYVALTTATIADSDTGTSITEPAGGSYARKQVNVNGGASPTWDLASGTSPTLVDNTHQIDMPTATASWGTVVAVAICDAATLGNLLFYDNAMTDSAVDNGDTASFAVGALDITLD